jgi:2'-5' RNA ligase
VRLFVALDLPEEVHHRLRDLIARLTKHCPDARWVRPEGMHITLKFIGHVDPAKADAIRLALQPVHSHAPVEMQIRGMGFFPNERRPRVVWCGVDATPNLADLAAQVERSLQPLGIEPESRAFTPHLTLARINEEDVRRAEIEKLVEAAKRLETTSFGSARESEFYLYESITKPAGAEYKRLQVYPFVKGSV